MSSTVWSYATFVLLPPAVVLLLLLTIPFPSLLLNRGIVKFSDVVLNLTIGTLNIFSIITTLAFLVLCAQTYDLQKRYSGVDIHYVEANYSADLQKKATRWRSERNWWISALTFTIYWMLFRFHAIKKQLLKAQRHND
uniref:BAP29/BAP31 transmembrane domain-containing protein n=1 Tax=Globisporangium ultimum (strain ATCC 200006 / CBS 805.95 / DAOM BR144) TaxID=431595 RepID=K3WFK4_GLOUD